eukprot:871742-Prymnesium_polylepis.1
METSSRASGSLCASVAQYHPQAFRTSSRGLSRTHLHPLALANVTVDQCTQRDEHVRMSITLERAAGDKLLSHERLGIAEPPLQQQRTREVGDCDQRRLVGVAIDDATRVCGLLGERLRFFGLSLREQVGDEVAARRDGVLVQRAHQQARRRLKLARERLGLTVTSLGLQDCDVPSDRLERRRVAWTIQLLAMLDHLEQHLLALLPRRPLCVETFERQSVERLDGVLRFHLLVTIRSSAQRYCTSKECDVASDGSALQHRGAAGVDTDTDGRPAPQKTVEEPLHVWL